jgi:hypothetical protein
VEDPKIIFLSDCSTLLCKFIDREQIKMIVMVVVIIIVVALIRFKYYLSHHFSLRRVFDNDHYAHIAVDRRYYVDFDTICLYHFD